MALLTLRHVEVDGCALIFETDYPGAADRLDGLLSEIFVSPYYDCRVGQPDPSGFAPTLRYLHRPEYRVEYCVESDVCTVAAPWNEIADSTILGMWLYYLSDLVRQRRGEYILHASAVARGGRSIVISGNGESGKTTLALHLCLAHDFKLVANNKVKVGLMESQPAVLRGDPVFNFRASSLQHYSRSLYEEIFAQGDSGRRPWGDKRKVSPSKIGVEIANPPLTISLFVVVSLDKEATVQSASAVLEGDTTHEGFWVQANLYSEMSTLIRGTRFAPLVGPAGFRDFYVPNLDTPEFVSRRVEFLRALFNHTRVVSIRGTLTDCVQTVLEQFDLQESTDTRFPKGALP